MNIVPGPVACPIILSSNHFVISTFIVFPVKNSVFPISGLSRWAENLNLETENSSSDLLKLDNLKT
jgi:hypothetical protein